MEVLVGSTFAIGVSSPAPYARDRSQDPDAGVPVSGTRTMAGSGLGLRLGGSMEALPEESTDSSSIGAPGDSDDEEEGEVVTSKGDAKLNRGFGSFGSLEEALPIKRGLSNHFAGKSKSFGNLSEVGSLKDLEKTENSLNKRRRVLIASRLSRKSFYSSSNPKSMPLFPVNEDDSEEAEYDEPSSSSSSSSEKDPLGRNTQFRTKSMHKRKLGGLTSQSCFSLSDLHEEEDQES